MDNLRDAINKDETLLFEQRLRQQLIELKSVIRQPEFGKASLCMGAELELYLIDNNYQAAPINQALLKQMNDPQFQCELNQYNIELNQSIFGLSGTPFTQLLDELKQKLSYADETAKQLDARVVPIGILPTLTRSHLLPDYMTPAPRYKLMTDSLCKMRGEEFHLNINGEDSLKLDFSNVTSEGANTSFQVHMMVEHSRFADIFNAAQLTLPFCTAIAANSPILLGNKLWDETRIALFKQSLDTRLAGNTEWREPGRVPFGDSWVRKDSWELFAQAVSLYPPILAQCAPQTDETSNGKNGLPKFHELCRHFGTVWPWNRPVYCAQDKGHVRIEFRALPAGPTATDMAANAAFAIGLATGMADHIEDYIASLPFSHAEYNFYRAAKNGLDATILWPQENLRPKEVPLISLLPQMVDIAYKGLSKLDVSEAEAKRFLSVISKRVEQKTNGAVWQKNTLQTLQKTSSTPEACEKMLAHYLNNVHAGIPISNWPSIK